MNEEIPYGYCHCGCGQKTTIFSFNSSTKGIIKGQPKKFLPFHNLRLFTKQRTSQHHNWKGGTVISSDGYVSILMPEHPRAWGCGYVKEHILIAEKALGKPLPFSARIHHANGTKTGPLVICENEQYHQYLHYRMRAYRACGHANWWRCGICKQWDKPENLHTNPKGKQPYHRICAHNYHLKRKAAKIANLTQEANP